MNAQTDLYAEIIRLREENADLHELVSAARESASPAPTLIPAEGATAEAADGGIVTVALNVDGQVWATRLDVLTPTGPDKLLDTRADAARFLYSAHLECAADDAALLVERVRAAVNEARVILNEAQLTLVTTMQVSADAMPADDLLAIKRAIGTIKHAISEINEAQCSARKAYSNLLNAGARRDVALPLHPGFPAGTRVVAGGAPPPTATTPCAHVIGDDEFWAQQAHALNGFYGSMDQGMEG
jgi:hypothetical protein